MGGDKAPGEILKGCFAAEQFLDGDDTLFLVGDEKIIHDALNGPQNTIPQAKRKHYKVIATTEVIEMDDPAAQSIRSKPNSSIGVMCKMAGKGEADAVVSAGNTGACVAAAQLRMRTLPGVERPGIGVILPTFHGPVVICDVGANIQPRPKHLQQYALMASAYSHEMFGIESPRVTLMSIGEEDAKGTTVVKDARKMMRDEPQINFVGNTEGRDIFKGNYDVMITDGFVGNIILKLAEGMGEGLFQSILTELQEDAPDLLEKFKPVMKKIYARHDWQEHGGAPLLGVGGICMICHGRSEARAIMNAIRVAKRLVNSGLNKRIVERIEKSIPVSEE
jgi:glycerol-3-phosphate acyltransferase PlsX